jgi:hypothetical protein
VEHHDGRRVCLLLAGTGTAACAACRCCLALMKLDTGV